MKYLITGATGGAGSAVAKMLALDHDLTLVGRNKEKLETLRQSLYNPPAHDIVISDFSLGEGPVLQGKYDGIFHGVGEELILPVQMIRAEKIRAAFEVNVHSAIWLCQEIGRRSSLLNDGGSLVLMSSVAAVKGTAGMTVYGACKAAIEGLVKNAAIEFAPRGIRVNAIRAGGFESPMHTRIGQRATPLAMTEYMMKHPLGFGLPCDIASMVLHLMSNRWITGSIITMDGGFLCQ
jgi:NAD(P)-dependent dehydrogenase (short-subunit alcohol dehydrogenase family)